MLDRGCRTSARRVSIWILTGCMLGFMPCDMLKAAELLLAWDAAANASDGSPVADVAGYRLYYGTTSGGYSNMIPAGLSLTATATNLQAGTPYYFAVAAYNAAGVESSLSAELTWTSPLSNLVDTDKDGMTDWEEQMAGTDPYNSHSVFSMTISNAPAARGAPGTVLQWTSVSGRYYQVLRSMDLMATPPFSNVGSPIQATGPITSFTDIDSPTTGARFYQIQVEP
ncbi:MAG: fibronectin type III domain-containing protein [bacterium]